jgi:hypothetical protein
MNKENAHLFLPLVQALADGKLQFKSSTRGWEDVKPHENIEFSFGLSDYRIKPEPREWDAIIGNDGCIRDARLCFDCVQSQSFRVREILD